MAEKSIHLALVLHAHQPTGNFDHVFRWSFENCYSPLVDELEKHPGIPVALHYSGILFEWLEKEEPEYLDRLRAMVERGQLEIPGGGFGEPILVMLSDEDRLGQLRAMNRFVEKRFGKAPRGAWLTERVWEQSLVHDLAGARLEYSMVDDSHFRLSGLRDDELLGSYVTEDRGKTIRLFPLSEDLRYHIPFKTVEETIAYLGENATAEGDRVLVYGDDAEKFGSWPGTYKHVYEDGWLARFFDALEENSSWIKMHRISDMLDLPPIGKVYLPDASYREMTEWALPTSAREEYIKIREEMGSEMADRAAPFFRGGNWRTFLSKYGESGEMYGKMIDVSRRVAAMPEKSRKKTEALMELYRGQCNCAFWHGVFGGLYLPHLRSAIHSKLIRAEYLADKAAAGRNKRWVDAEKIDLDLDGFDEVRLSSDSLLLSLHPRRGGHIYGIDDRVREINVTATMTRRPEAYHADVRDSSGPGDAEVASIHDGMTSKEEGLDKLLIYDRHRRESLVDHFYPVDADFDSISGHESPELGDFTDRPYDVEVERGERSARVRMSRVGNLNIDGVAHSLRVAKDVVLEAGKPHFDIRYTLTNEGDTSFSALFSVEFALALLAGDAPDRNILREGKSMGPLAGRYDLKPCAKFGVRDEWLNLSARYILDSKAPVWVFPVETVSISEGGYEKVYQCTLFLPRWRISLEPKEKWEVGIQHSFLNAK